MIYENDRFISQRKIEILKSIMAILIYTPGSFWFISSKKFQDGEKNRLIFEIKRVAIDQVFFE